MKLCLVGDSIIEYYDWQSRFPRHTVANLGVSGETAAELLFRIPYLGLAAEQPEAVVIMTGTNDILMESDFLPTYEQIVITLRQILPKALLVTCGLLPMSLPWLDPDAVPKANARLEALAQRHKIGYLDGASLVPDATKKRLFFSDDGVHLTPHGYDVWSMAIENHLHL